MLFPFKTFVVVVDADEVVLFVLEDVELVLELELVEDEVVDELVVELVEELVFLEFELVFNAIV